MHAENGKLSTYLDRQTYRSTFKRKRLDVKAFDPYQNLSSIVVKQPNLHISYTSLI